MDDYETATLEVEKEKLQIERQKINLSIVQARWTAVSVIVPVIIAASTIIYGIWSASITAEMNFQLEAVKSAMQAKNDEEAKEKLYFYARMFPDKLPASFLSHLGTLHTTHANDDPNSESKIKYLEVLAETKGATPEQVMQTWRILFDGDQWAKDEKLDAAWHGAPTKP